MSREKAVELAGRLRDAARMQDPYAKAAIEYVRLTYELTRDSLVTTDGPDMLLRQGLARGLHKMLRELTEMPPNIAPEKN